MLSVAHIYWFCAAEIQRHRQVLPPVVTALAAAAAAAAATAAALSAHLAEKLLAVNPDKGGFVILVTTPTAPSTAASATPSLHL
jgi:hypothetical protein